MLCIVSFLHVLEASIIDVTSVSGVGDGYCATLTAQSFYRRPAYKIFMSKIGVELESPFAVKISGVSDLSAELYVI